MTIVFLLAVLALAYANGANDNFKGVATLYGSGTSSFRRALALSTAATILGSALSIMLARELVRSFSGRGLVPDALVGETSFLIAVAGGGAATVLLATRLGLPTSTTHALTGALVGVSVLHHGKLEAGGMLWSGFLQPLLLSPLLAVLAASILSFLATRRRQGPGGAPDACLCIAETAPEPVSAGPGAPALRVGSPRGLTVMVGTDAECATAPAVVRLRTRPVIDWLHELSGASVCFARSVNDTPKIAALWIGTAGATSWPLVAVTVAVAAGGLLSARRVAETMSHRITTMDPGLGAIGNLVTAAIVLGASRLGMPVSTTHVSVGSIMGIGAISRRANGRVIGQVLLAWLVTLPLGALLGGVLFSRLH